MEHTAHAEPQQYRANARLRARRTERKVVPVPAGVTHVTAVVEIQIDWAHGRLPMVAETIGTPSEDGRPKFVPPIVSTALQSVGPFALDTAMVTIGAS